MNDARKTRGRSCAGGAGVSRARSRPGAGRMPALPAGPGQALVEFAIVATILLGLTLVVIDLARAGLMQHDLDSGAGDLARSLAAISGVNSSGNTGTYTPTALDPTAPAIPTAVAHAAQIANYNFNATPPLAATGPLTQTGSTLTNGQVTVAVTPTLSAPTEITVTITAPFTPVVGFYLNHSILSMQARSSAITPLGELGP
jgi:Flp pilus assembly protein TadG